MKKRKQFGVPSLLAKGLSETLSIAENANMFLRNSVIPLSRIEVDPDNPRQMKITQDDVKGGVKTGDPDSEKKNEELEKIKELSNSILKSGLINPITVYKDGQIYRIVAGERRYLATLLAGRAEIESRIFDQKPTILELKLVQWYENTAREDLSLYERVDNVVELIRVFKGANNVEKVTATDLKSLTGLSLQQASCYVNVISGPPDVLDAVKTGLINSLDKASLLAAVENSDLRKDMLSSCVAGDISLSKLREKVRHDVKLKRNEHPKSIEGTGSGLFTIKTQVSLKSMEHIIKAIFSASKNQLRSEINLKTINWGNKKEVLEMFKKITALLNETIIYE
jgi:ParB family transcriptional regulator, chromosome partitioning protein